MFLTIMPVRAPLAAFARTLALGFSAPSRDYPTVTHVRGFANHLIYGAVAP